MASLMRYATIVGILAGLLFHSEEVNPICGSAIVSNNTILTLIRLNALTSFSLYMRFNPSNNLYPSMLVNYLLDKFVTVTPPMRFGIFDFRQFVPAPPTGQGLTDKATLIAGPNTVNTDYFNAKKKSR